MFSSKYFPKVMYWNYIFVHTNCQWSCYNLFAMCYKAFVSLLREFDALSELP